MTYRAPNTRSVSSTKTSRTIRPRRFISVMSMVLLSVAVLATAVSAGYFGTRYVKKLGTTNKRVEAQPSKKTKVNSTVSRTSLAMTQSSEPSLSTDKLNYSPGDTALISGSGFAPSTTVTLQVKHTDEDVQGGNGHAPWNVSSDALGNLSTTWFVDPDDSANADFILIATDANGKVLAVHYFTDGNPAANLDQCANGGVGKPHEACALTNWVNGNLGGSKAHYNEGDSVPYRLRFSNLSLVSHTVTFSWDTTKGGKHALDYVTSFDRTETLALGNDPCSGVAGCSLGTFTTAPIPIDVHVQTGQNGIDDPPPGSAGGDDIAQVPGVFTLFGGTITNVSSYTLSGSYGGDSTTTITLTFTANQDNPVLSWGGHIATRIDWGLTNSAVSIPGSPYHTSLDDLDGSGGSQDRSLSADAVIFPGSITIIKDTVPDGPRDFNFSTTGGLTPATFILDDDGGLDSTHENTQSYTNILVTDNNGNDYSVTETPVNGWDLSFNNPVCTVTSANGGSQSATTNGVNINLREGENVTCTFINTENTNVTKGKIKIVKQTLPDGSTQSFDFTTNYGNGFSLTDGQSNTSSALTPSAEGGGPYSVSETGVQGWVSDGGVCDHSSTPSNITVVAGETTTCTFTNTQSAKLTVKKHVINDNGGSLTASNFTLHVKSGGSDVSGSPQPGSETGTEYTLAPGSYVFSENAPPSGYASDGISGDCAANGSITLAPGDNKTCTVTNNDQAAHLIVIKHVVNNNGGTKAASDFTTTISGVSTANPTAAGAESPGVDNTLTSVGSYSVDEGAHVGYDKSLSADCSGTIALGETKTCTITNDDQAAHLIVIKHVINNNGGSKQASDFSTTISGVSTANPTAPGAESPGVDNTLTTVGSYSVDEGAHVGYDKSLSADCSGTIALGETKTCTITNDDQAAHLIVIKHVINDNGGSKQASDFSTTISGVSTTNPTAPGAESPGVDNTLTTVGSYSVDEGAHVGYDKSLSADCSGTIALGETKTCTITNDDQAAHLIVIKHVINNNGGSKQASDFSTTISGVSTANPTAPGAESPGVDNTLTTVGSYSVDEGAHLGYDKSLSADCSGTIALGETKTCTITNDDQAAHLIVIKHVINDNGGSKQASDFSTTISGVTTANPTAPGAESPGVDNTLTSVGSYSVDEGAHVGYDKTLSAYCSGTIALGQTKTCTITNNDIPPKLHLRKIVQNTHGGTAMAADFTLTANGTGSNDLSGTTPVDSGAGLQADTWALSETSMYGYTASAWSCVGGTQNGSNITVGIGGEATCTITNSDVGGTIIIQKNADPASGVFTFQTTGTGYIGFMLNGGPVTGQQNTQSGLSVGTYTVKELTQLGWTLTAIGGSGDPINPNTCQIIGSGGSTGSGDAVGTQTATISLKNGDTVKCVFENTGNGATRTQGFWATHPQLANLAWFGGSGFGHSFPGVANTPGIGDRSLCARSIDTLGKLMGAFWSDVSKTSTGKKRSALDQARMQLLQQLLAAELNASAFGSVPSSGSFAAWESAYCGTNQSAIQTAQQQAGSFNSKGDSSTFTPGTAADSKNARAISNYLFWDVLP